MMTGFEGFRNENSDRIEASKRKFLIFNIRCLKHLEQLDASLGLRLCFCGYVSVCLSVCLSSLLLFHPSRHLFHLCCPSRFHLTYLYLATSKGHTYIYFQFFL